MFCAISSVNAQDAMSNMASHRKQYIYIPVVCISNPNSTQSSPSRSSKETLLAVYISLAVVYACLAAQSFHFLYCP